MTEKHSDTFLFTIKNEIQVHDSASVRSEYDIFSNVAANTSDVVSDKNSKHVTVGDEVCIRLQLGRKFE